MTEKELVSPCGLYCGVCGIYQATVNNDEKLKEKLAAAYGVPIEKCTCKGCLSDTVFSYCGVCPIKRCALEKKLQGCFQCDEFPCSLIESFPVAEGKKNILRSVPLWKKLGTEEWIAHEKMLFSCKNCGAALFRGARKCRSCNALLQA